MLNVGGAELLIILLVALVVLGPQRLPDVARQLGQTVSSLRSLAAGFQAEMEAASKPITEAMKPVTDAANGTMSLDGPTDQAEAIAKTQTDPFAGKRKQTVAPRKPTSRTDIDHVIKPDVAQTDTASLAKAAREVEYHDDEDAHSEGGPTDLRDEEE